MATKSRRKVDTAKARIRIEVKENPRRSDSGAGKRFSSMVGYVRKHRTATAKDVLTKTSYRSDDLRWDLERGHIKLVSAR